MYSSFSIFKTTFLKGGAPEQNHSGCWFKMLVVDPTPPLEPESLREEFPGNSNVNENPRTAGLSAAL